MTETEIHPELRAIARFLPRSMGTPVKARMLRCLNRLPSRRPAGVTVESVGDIAVRVHRPPAGTAALSPAILWIHGGGYVMGRPAQDDALCQRFAREVGAVVVAPGYRLAPAHPYPAAVEDCHDALVWLAARGDVDPSRIAIGGASAGGGLAAALAILARQRGQVRPVFQLLTYPMLDDRTVMRTDIDEKHHRLWDCRSNAYGWRSYLGREPGTADVPGTAAPARETDLTNLPPAWIGVGTHDLFHDEDVAYAKRLREAGVPCDVEVVPGAFHGFDGVAPKSTVAASFREHQVTALRSALS